MSDLEKLVRRFVARSARAAKGTLTLPGFVLKANDYSYYLPRPPRPDEPSLWKKTDGPEKTGLDRHPRPKAGKTTPPRAEIDPSGPGHKEVIPTFPVFPLPRAHSGGDEIRDHQIIFNKYDNLLKDRNLSVDEYTSPCSGRVESEKPGKGGRIVNEGRLLICRSYRGQEIGVTIRTLKKADCDDGDFETLESRAKACDAARLPPGWRECDPEARDGETFSGYSPKPKPGDPHFPVGLKEVCDELDRLIFGPGDAHPTGLVLVTGSTNSTKSELTRGLIHRELARQVGRGPKRRPHLLTYEDPIEKWFAETSGDALRNYGIDYTPRERGSDVASLEAAINDALRQTPSVFYVGEVREDNDWAQLLKFAGTGHLVVATSHAGSLVEAMERIFRGMKAKTAAERGQVAQKILAVVHQIAFHPNDLGPALKGLPGTFPVLLQALWRRTPGGVASLVSDGLSSVLPNNPSDPSEPSADGTPPEPTERESKTSSFGRHWFAKRFADTERWAEIILDADANTSLLGTDRDKAALDLASKARDRFIGEAIRLDLQGI